jgi:uncharacterized membrane-anchored protein
MSIITSFTQTAFVVGFVFIIAIVWFLCKINRVRQVCIFWSSCVVKASLPSTFVHI